MTEMTHSQAEREVAERTALRRALKALDALESYAAEMTRKVTADMEIDAESAGRTMGSYLADAIANMSTLEVFRDMREWEAKG